MNKNMRIAVGALGLSMAGFVGITSHEGWADKAMVPTKNDRPTVGFGSTFNADGTPVKMGDTITPPRAIVLAAAHLSKEEGLFRASIPNVALHQAEYDVYMDWVYQYGSGAWDKSTMRRELLLGNYAAACGGFLLYKKSGGFDCSIPGNKVCAGVWKRQLERHHRCMGAQ